MKISGSLGACGHDCAGCPAGESEVGGSMQAGPVRPSGRVVAGAAAIFLVPLLAAAVGGWLGRSVAGLQAPGAVAGLAAAIAVVRRIVGAAGPTGAAS